MKRLLFVFMILLCTSGMYSQQYKVTVSGYIGSGPSSCGSNNNGLKWIRLYFSDGTDEYLFRQDNGQFRNQSYSFTSTTNYNVNKRLLRVGFRTVSRERRTLGDCSSSKVREAFVNVSSPCFLQNFPKEDIYERRINRGNAIVSVVPIMDLSFKDGSSVTNIYSGCEGGTIDIDATAGFTPNTDIYTWEFNDPVNTATQTHPDYQALQNEVARAQGAYQGCIRATGDPDRCEPQFIALIEAQRNLNNYTGPQTIQVPVWRPITSKIGQSSIELGLSDLYNSLADQKAAVNKNIDIRISPSCNAFNARTNMLTIQYLVDPPKITRDPEVSDLLCSYSATAGVTLFFDRQVDNSEEIDISLLRRLDNGTTYVPFDDNTNITSFTPLNATTWTHRWVPSSGKEIRGGQYELRVTGYQRGGSSASAFCEAFTYRFNVNSPSRVVFGASKNQDETCYNKKDGVILITASGGTENYNFQVRNGSTLVRSGSFTRAQSPFRVENLAPATYTINVTDSNNCEDRITVQQPIQIRRIDQITHEVTPNGITLPSATGNNDGRITIRSVTGGTKFSGTGYDYIYEILLNGSTTNTLSGQAFSVGYDIINLPAGTHTIRYEDANNCKEDIVLPEIAEPVSITNVEVTPIECFGGKATVTLTATGGYSRAYDYAIWTGLPLQNSDWQSSNIFSLDANVISGYRFVARDRSATNYISQPSASELIDQPSRIRITRTEVKHNNIFGDNKGEITLTISGGTPRTTSPEYIVAWQKDGLDIPNTGMSISGLLAGVYVATIRDDNSCPLVSGTITVNEPDELLVSIRVAMQIPCFDGTGSLVAEPSGGSGTYTYTWFKDGSVLNGETSINLSGIQAGNYTVQVNDSFITKQGAIDFQDPDQLSLGVSKEDVSCFNGNDGKIILSPTGGTRPYSFSINNKISYVSENDLTNLTIEGLSSGRYDVWLKDQNDCEIVTPQSITIGEPNEIEINQVALNYVTVNGGNDGNIAISVTGGTGNYSFSWEKRNDPTFNRTTQDIDNLSSGFYTVTVKDEKNCENSRTFEMKQPLPIQVGISEVIPILCHDDALGELLATVQGGFPIDSSPSDFEYRWYRIENGVETSINTDLTLSSLENLSAGTYKVVATDSRGSSAEDTFNLLEPDDLVVTLAAPPVDVKCFGESTGAINITVVGGPRDEVTGDYLPYSFRWTKVEDPGFSANTEDLQNISAGTYEVVIIDDNLCPTSLAQPIVIDQPDATLEIYDVLPVNLTGFQTQNGSISLEVRGGTTPYTYTWTNLDDPTFTSSDQDIMNLDAGRYELVVTDTNDCQAFLNQVITQPDELVVNIIPISTDNGIQCFGENTLVPLTTNTQGGIGSYTYEWYEQSDPSNVLFTTPETSTLKAGTYVVVVTDENGNKDDDVYEVIQPDRLEITESVTHLLCNGDSNGQINITVAGGVAPYSFRWSNGETTEDISSLRAGNYNVRIVDANDCVLEKEITIDQPPALFIDGNIIRLYPSTNGANDGSITVNIGGGTPPYDFEWRDFNGNLQSSTTNVLDNIGVDKYSLRITDSNSCELFIPDVDLFEPPALAVRIERQNVISCFGDTSGSLVAVVTGGRPFNAVKQYNYQWYSADLNTPIGADSFLLENISAGNYYVLVSDAVDTEATSTVFLLDQPDLLSVDLETSFVNCGDGNDWTITPRITGGTAPFTYLWSNNATTSAIQNVLPSVYSLEIVDVRGCRATSQVTLTPPAPLEITESLTIPTCYGGNDGAISLETTGGTPPYAFEWSNGNRTEDIQNIPSGSYIISITDSKGCRIQRNIVLNDPDQLVVDLGEDITLCKDQTIVLNATISDPNATYIWSSANGYSSNEPFIEVEESSIYEVIVTDSKGCIATDSIFIDRVTDIISAQFIASTQVFTGEEFVIVDNSDPIPDALEWIFPAEAIVTYKDNNYAELIFESPGEYEITMQTKRGLCSASITKTIFVVDKEFEDDETESSSEIQSYIDYLIYPNPTRDGKFKVDVSMSEKRSITLKIYNIINNTLIDFKEGKDNDTYTFSYDMSSLPSGVYFILLETSSASQVRKLVIE